MIAKIESGGQTGENRAGLDVAIEEGTPPAGDPLGGVKTYGTIAVALC
jgi:hypothetical protein